MTMARTLSFRLARASGSCCEPLAAFWARVDMRPCFAPPLRQGHAHASITYRHFDERTIIVEEQAGVIFSVVTIGYGSNRGAANSSVAKPKPHLDRGISTCILYQCPTLNSFTIELTNCLASPKSINVLSR